jgi:hypothetical protein
MFPDPIEKKRISCADAAVIRTRSASSARGKTSIGRLSPGHVRGKASRDRVAPAKGKKRF